MEVLRPGVMQYVTSDILIASKGRKLYISKDSGSNWQDWSSLPVSTLDKCWSLNRWLSRFSRKEIHHLIEVDDQFFACFGFGKIYLIERETGNVETLGNIKGSRPLKVCSDGKNLYYGVYTRNKEREPIDLYSYNLDDQQWSAVHTFKNIRHIHGVFWDRYTSKLWATTGDLNNESSIWCFNEKNNPKKIATGSQQTRAVDLLFTEEAIFYATDAPDDPNFIYRCDRKNGNKKRIQKVGGPVFYGRKESGWLFFSTVVEPSKVNRTDAVELWGSCDNGYSWKKIKEFKKDIGHMKLFQYGQIKFTNGPGDHKYLNFTPYATEYDHKVARIRLESL